MKNDRGVGTQFIAPGADVSADGTGRYIGAWRDNADEIMLSVRDSTLLRSSRWVR